MNSAHPEVELRSYLERQTNLYLKGFAYLRDFDRNLDSALTKLQVEGKYDTTPMTSIPSYAKLLAVRTLSHRISHRIQFIYGRLIYISSDRNFHFKVKDYPDKETYLKAEAAFRARYATAKGILGKFNDGLRLRKKSEIDLQKIVLSELYLNLANEISEYTSLRSDNPHKYKIEDQAQLNASLKDALKQAAPFAATSQELTKIASTNASLFERAGLEALQQNDDELDEHIKQKQEELRLHALAQGLGELSKRSPNASANIHPSTGADGNVTGNTFPVNTWALTYDDGPSLAYTPLDLKNLEANHIKATFFWLAENVKRYPKIVASVIDAGMAVETHSYTHPNLPSLKPAAWDHEILAANSDNAKVYGDGHTPTFYRLPYGSGMGVAGIRQRIVAAHDVHVFWNVDTLDWQDHNPASIFRRTLKQMQLLKRGIILFHDIHPQSVEASRMIMEWANKQNAAEEEPSKKMRWVTLPEIIEELNK